MWLAIRCLFNALEVFSPAHYLYFTVIFLSIMLEIVEVVSFRKTYHPDRAPALQRLRARECDKQKCFHINFFIYRLKFIHCLEKNIA